MTKKQIVIFAPLMILATVILAGCDVSTINSTVQRVIGGKLGAIDQAKEVKIAAENLNPVFASEEAVTTQDPTASQVNQLLSASLQKTFVDDKLVAIQNEGKPPFMLRYVVKRRINQADGDVLHKTLIDSGSREKSDSKPNFYSGRNTEEFSVYHDFGGRSYIIAVVMDLAEQVIWASVY
jgi:hypothetical protein